MALVLTNVYLEKEQREFLAKKARAGKRAGSSLSSEVRKAVDLYRSGVTADELAMLDVGTKKAEDNLKEMADILDKGAKRATKFFAEIKRIRKEAAAWQHSLPK